MSTWVLYPLEPQSKRGNYLQALMSLRRNHVIYCLDGGCLAIEDPKGRLTLDTLDRIRPYVRAIVSELIGGEQAK